MFLIKSLVPVEGQQLLIELVPIHIRNQEHFHMLN
jgi:hypothetical protein